MRFLQTVLFIILGYYLLIYLWPLFLFFILIIIYWMIRARIAFKKAFDQQTAQSSQQTYQTFRQDGSSDVIDADYKERDDQ